MFRNPNKSVVILIIIFSFSSIMGDAQSNLLSEQWNKTFGGVNNDTAMSVQLTIDTGYILTGETESYGAGKRDAWLIRTDSNGTELWSKTFGGTDFDDAQSIQQTSDNGFILSGDTWSSGAGGSDAWLIKTDTNGNHQWSKKFGGTGDDFASAVQQTLDGGYIIGGWTEKDTRNSDAWLIKTDTNGNQQWSKTFGGTSFDGATYVRQTSEGGYVLVGLSGSYGPNSDALLIKTDANGNQQWIKTFGNKNNDYANSLQQTSDRGFIISGGTYTSSGDTDAWLIKIDANSNQEWSKTFGGQNDDSGSSVIQASDGGYYLAGSTESYGVGKRDAWLIKTDSNGTELWSKTFGGKNDDSFGSISQTSDGYVLAGTTWSYGTGKQDAWLVKLSPPAPAPSSIPTSTAMQTVSSTEPPTVAETQTVSPTEKAYGFELILAITAISTIFIIGRNKNDQ